MNKKGTHVEVIISFIIFITFVIFLFAASKPSITKQEDKRNLFDSLEYQIIENVSSDVKVISITLPVGAASCVNLGNFLSDYDINGRVVVKDSSGTKVGAHIDGNAFAIDSTDTFFKIYYSEEFTPISPGGACTPLAPNVGITKKNKYVFQQNVIDTININYNGLKQGFEVNENMDFTLGIVLSDGAVIEKPHQELITNISTSIYVNDKPIEYIDLDGDILAGHLRTKIW